MTNWYFLINNNYQHLADIRAQCFLKHALATNNQNELSEVISFDGNERLIKVSGVDSNWIADQSEWINNAEACIWNFPQVNDPEDIGTKTVAAWAQSQDPEFDSPDDGDELPDTSEQRRSWWQRLLGV